MVNEVIRTTGDLRRHLGDILVAVTKGDLDVGRAQAAAAAAKEINASMVVEINAAKVNLALSQAGKGIKNPSRPAGRLGEGAALVRE